MHRQSSSWTDNLVSKLQHAILRQKLFAIFEEEEEEFYMKRGPLLAAHT